MTYHSHHSAVGDALAGVAIIASFEPASGILGTVRELVADGHLVCIVDDASKSAEAEAVLRACEKLGAKLLRKTENSGIASSLNAGLRWATRTDVKYILTLDQDTEIPHKYFSMAIERFETLQQRGASIGAITAGRMNGSNRRPRRPSFIEAYDEAIDVMQSGLVTPVDIANKLGGFRDGFVMDCVDTDFCLKLRATNYSILWLDDLELKHELGDTQVATVLGRPVSIRGRTIHVSNHSSSRRYYMSRNRVILLAEYARRDREWARKARRGYLKEAILSLIFEKHRGANFLATTRGIYHGLLRREGRAR